MVDVDDVFQSPLTESNITYNIDIFFSSVINFSMSLTFDFEFVSFFLHHHSLASSLLNRISPHFQVPTAVRALVQAAAATDLDLLVVTLVPVVSAELEPVALDQASEALDQVSVEPALAVAAQALVDLEVPALAAVALEELVASEVLPPVSTSPPTLEAGDPDQETSTPRLDTATKMETAVVMHGGDDCANVEQKLRKQIVRSVNKKICHRKNSNNCVDFL